MPFTRHHGDEPPASVAELMRTQNVVLALQNLVSHTRKLEFKHVRMVLE